MLTELGMMFEKAEVEDNLSHDALMEETRRRQVRITRVTEELTRSKDADDKTVGYRLRLLNEQQKVLHDMGVAEKKLELDKRRIELEEEQAVFLTNVVVMMLRRYGVEESETAVRGELVRVIQELEGGVS